ncbi:MAG: ribonuclease HII [Chloroflexi bacterium]|nr:ribonuclease HII [Chloroflexota bacterium]
MRRIRPTWRHERALWRRGFGRVAGIDEVGRGPLAGPVMAAAVVLPPHYKAPWVAGLRDSKMLSPRQREALDPLIRRAALAFGVGAASVEEIDTLGIVGATRAAMLRALDQLAPGPDSLLVDALRLPEAGLPCEALVHGDALCCSIAAASVVAKVARDRLMAELDGQYPGYGLAAHKGYPTPEHLRQLACLGPSPIHRRSFGPVRAFLDGNDVGQ